MKKIQITGILFLFICNLFAQTPQERKIQLHYIESFPMAFKNGSESDLAGVEIDIIKYFAEWCRKEKSIALNINYQGHRNFDEFLKKVESGDEYVMGAGTVTITDERKKRFKFTAPYLNNISVLISNGTLPTLHKKSEAKDLLKSKKVLVTQSSTHRQYAEDLKNQYANDVVIEELVDQKAIPEMVLKNPNYIGFVDIITYWNFIDKMNDEKMAGFLKIQRVFSVNEEHLSFIFPKNSELHALFSEFFESGFGFTSTKMYRNILEKYLGEELLKTVEIDH